MALALSTLASTLALQPRDSDPAEPPLTHAPLLSPDEPAAPCGWWDSSFDLRDGLCVTECADFSPLGLQALPLSQLLGPSLQ